MQPVTARRSVTCDGQSHLVKGRYTLSCFMLQKPELGVGMGYEPVRLENLYVFSSCVTRIELSAYTCFSFDRFTTSFASVSMGC